MVHQRFSNRAILDQLQCFGFDISERSLRRYLEKHDISRLQLNDNSYLWIAEARKLVSMNVTAEQICAIIAKNLNIYIGESSLRKILKDNGITWRSQLEQFEVEQLVMVNNTGLLGCRMMQSRLRILTGENISRDSVLQALHTVDPNGIEIRSRRRLHRRSYDVPGPNFMWHFDGHDKLSKCC
jgi:hypothetical protein